MMTDTEALQAVEALKSWFKSQDLDPDDAGIIMISLLAQLYTQKTRDLGLLQKAIESHNLVLALEIARYVRL